MASRNYTKSRFRLTDPLISFLGIGAVLSIASLVAYHLLLDKEWINTRLSEATVTGTEAFIRLLGYSMFREGTVLGLEGTIGLKVGPPCNGLGLFVLFSIFVMAFPGPAKHKLWFIPSGLLLLYVLNVMRVFALCLLLLHHPDWLAFNHSYTFTVTMYFIVLLLWMTWINRWSRSLKHAPSS